MSIPAQFPANKQEFQTLIQDFIHQKKRVAIVGNGSRSLIPEEITPISTQHLNQVDFFHPEDMVIGVESGMKFADLQKVLLEKNKYLPIDPFQKDSTIGSIIACADSGASRLFMGGLRDYIIGIEYINAEGKLVKGGGKVVKNVAGYDIMKMMLGSKGGYGAITKVNFKIVPFNPNRYSYLIRFDDLSWCKGLIALAQEKLPIHSLEVAFNHQEVILNIGFEGKDLKRERIVQFIEMQLKKGELIPYSERTEPLEWNPIEESQIQNMASFPKDWKEDKKGLHLKIFTLSSLLMQSNFWHKINQIKPQCAWIAHPFGGDFQLICLQSDWRAQLEIIVELQKILEGTEARFKMMSLHPEAIKNHLFPKNDLDKLALILKKKLDPHQIFFSHYFDNLLNEST